MSYAFPVQIWIVPDCSNFTVIVSGESWSLVYIDSPLLNNIFRTILIPWGSLADNNWGVNFFLVYYNLRSSCVGGAYIHSYTNTEQNFIISWKSADCIKFDCYFEYVSMRKGSIQPLKSDGKLRGILVACLCHTYPEMVQYFKPIDVSKCY